MLSYLCRCEIPLGVEPAEPSEIAENSELFWDLLGLLFPRPSPEENRYENGWIERESR